MAIKESKVRVSITIEKNSQDIIKEFSSALKMSFSEFVEGVCLKFIEEVVENSKKLRKEKN